LGERELYETVEKEGKVEVHCHFCNKHYAYYEADIKDLIATAINKKG
ncbi:MAG: Hsp33 family molecular chaperone HslO, partial [Clostridia bacterium]|nr:Hsp33 family molecular chaperone HslO [Clostridia bacterium]